MARGRYEGLERAAHLATDPDGSPREIPYLLPRVPRDPPATLLAVHRVLADDRADLVAHRYLGDPQAWWRICDANLALDPDALIGPGNAGTDIVIGVPEA